VTSKHNERISKLGWPRYRKCCRPRLTWFRLARARVARRKRKSISFASYLPVVPMYSRCGGTTRRMVARAMRRPVPTNGPLEFAANRKSSVVSARIKRSFRYQTGSYVHACTNAQRHASSVAHQLKASRRGLKFYERIGVAQCGMAASSDDETICRGNHRIVVPPAGYRALALSRPIAKCSSVLVSDLPGRPALVARRFRRMLHS
jgi:hypothetical protein